MKISMNEYRKRKGVSSTALRYFAQSPKAYWAYEHGEMMVETAATNLGTAVHAFLESEYDYDETYVVKNGDLDRRTKAGKEEYARLLESGKQIIAREDDDKVRRMADSFYSSSDPILRMIHKSLGDNEESLFWNEFCLPMKARIDRIVYPDTDSCYLLEQRFGSLHNCPFGWKVLVDYKTTAKPIDPQSFRWIVRNSQYDLQASHYLSATQADAFIWVVLQSVPPFDVTRYVLSQETYFQADQRRNELLRQLADCISDNEFPGIRFDDKDALI